MTRVDRACAVIVLAVTGIVCERATAHAQSAEAEMLFREGRDLLKQGKIAAGCDKLVASERLESSVGTLLNLGDCREKLGKLASAWAAFRKAEAMAKRTGGDDKRQAEASRRAARLEPQLPNLEIDVPHRVDGLVVRCDGEIVTDAQWSTARPLDPGNYTITAEAPGYQAWRTTVPVRPGTKRQVVVVPDLAPLPVAPGAEVSAIPRPAPRTTPVVGSTVVMRRGRTWSTTRVLSVGLGLAGAGALGTGIYFGVHANTLQDRANRRCPLAVCADPLGLAQNAQAQTSARRANILYLAGGATLAAATVLWFAGAPDETIMIPTAGTHQLGVAMTGRF
jgi:hypothetical protein